MAENLTLTFLLALIAFGVVAWARQRARNTIGVANADSEARAAALLAEAASYPGPDSAAETTYVGKHRAPSTTPAANTEDRQEMSGQGQSPGVNPGPSPAEENEAIQEPSASALHADLRAFFGD